MIRRESADGPLNTSLRKLYWRFTGMELCLEEKPAGENRSSHKEVSG